MASIASAALALLVAVGIVLVVLSPLLLLLIARGLAELRFVLVLALERQAILIERGGKFRKAVMACTGYRWRGSSEWTEDEQELTSNKSEEEIKELFLNSKLEFIEPHLWDIVPDPPETITAPSRLGRLTGGIHILGIPYLDQVKFYSFTWTSREQVEQQGEDIKYQYKTEKRPLDYVLVRQDDVYYIAIKNAEDSEGVPLKIVLAITAQIVNPYKAVYGAVHWLEALENQLADRVRSWTRSLKYAEMDKYQDKDRDSLSKALSSLEILADFTLHYGVKVRLVQIDNIEPSGDLGAKYRALTTLEYEAEREKRKRVLTGEGERSFLENTIGYVAEDPARVVAWKWQNVSNLNTYVEGGAGVIPAISLGQQGEKKEEKK